jgi:hypothetical protein
LLKQFGDRFKVTFDPAYDARGRRRNSLDPWAVQIPCQRDGVTIYPFGGTTLAIEVDRRPKLANRLAAISGVVLWQDGDDEKTFLFHASLFETVAAVAKPRRRVQPGNADRLSAHRYRHGGRFSGHDGASEDQSDHSGTPEPDRRPDAP